MTVTRILHRAGNVASLLVLARHPAVDAIEADAWVHGDRILVHHERPLGPVPLLVGWGGLRRRSSALQLETVLEATAGCADLVIDHYDALLPALRGLGRGLAR